MSKRNLLILALLILPLLVLECSTEVIVNTPMNSIPVVYGVIDPWSDNYLLYIAKSAQAEEDVNQVIQYPGLFRPDSVVVKMELWNDSLMLWYTYFHPDTREKLPGLFPNGSGLVMVADRVIPRKVTDDKVDFTYPDFHNLRFFVTSPDFSQPAYARIKYSKPVPILQPYFADQNVRLYGPDRLAIVWPEDTNFKYFDLYFRVRYSEVSDSTRNSSVSFCYSHDVQSSNNQFEVRVEPDRFLSDLANELSRDTLPCEIRHIKDFDIIVAGGDINFEYYLVQERFGSVIYQKPWSNIVNGLGVIALKSESRKNSLRFHPLTMDSIAIGQYTKQFKFVRW